MENKEVIKLLLDKIQEQSNEIARLKAMINISNNKTNKVTYKYLYDMFADDSFGDIESNKKEETKLKRMQNMISEDFWNI